MSSQDRYFPRQQSDRYNPLARLLRLPVLSLSGIRFKVHISLVLFVAFTLLVSVAPGYTVGHRIASMGILCVVLVLHEMAHCLAARLCGGYPETVVICPVGGLVDPATPEKPSATFTARAAGPVLNLVLLTVAAGLLHRFYQIEVPLSLRESLLAPGDWSMPQFYIWYVYVTSAALLLLNLLPIYPLDGAHLLQTLLWPVLGYGKSLLVTTHVAIAASILAGAQGFYMKSWLLVGTMVACGLYSLQQRGRIKMVGISSFSEYDIDTRRGRRRRWSRLARWRVKRQMRLEEKELAHLDTILDKVQHQGLRSLNLRERHLLRRATRRYRQREGVG